MVSRKVDRRAEIAALAAQVRRVGSVDPDRALYVVPSSRDPQVVYLVDLDTGPRGWCSCPAYHYSRHETCKHLKAVAEFLRGEAIRARMQDLGCRLGWWGEGGAQ